MAIYPKLNFDHNMGNYASQSVRRARRRGRYAQGQLD